MSASAAMYLPRAWARLSWNSMPLPTVPDMRVSLELVASIAEMPICRPTSLSTFLEGNGGRRTPGRRSWRAKWNSRRPEYLWEMLQELPLVSCTSKKKMAIGFLGSGLMSSHFWALIVIPISFFHISGSSFPDCGPLCIFSSFFLKKTEKGKRKKRVRVEEGEDDGE